MSKVKVYTACSWFNPEQAKTLEKALALLKKNPTVDWEGSYRPTEHQWGNHVFETDPVEDEKWLGDKDWQRHTYRNDIIGLKRCDLALFIRCDDGEDPGQAFELGFATALQKPTVFAMKELTGGKSHLNLMLAMSPDIFIKIDDLDKFDFTNFDFEEYVGKVY